MSNQRSWSVIVLLTLISIGKCYRQIPLYDSCKKDNTDYYGNDLAGRGGIPVSTEGECVTECQRRAGCVAFTVVDGTSCYPKDAITPATIRTGQDNKVTYEMKCLRDAYWASCDGDICDENAHCVENRPISSDCTCNAGYQGDGLTCTDADECVLGTHTCHAQASCVNTVGGFNCTCNSGYQGDGGICVDEDECLGNPCDTNARCENTPGSYSCTCNNGFSGDGEICSDVDECASDDGNDCHAYAHCTNTPGAFECNCVEGFLGDGKTCYDKNECRNESDNNCHENADCVNVPGSFNCTCKEGYLGDGVSCYNLDECVLAEDNSCDPEAACTDTEGGYNCTCNDGYHGDGFTCTDINECEAGEVSCHAAANCLNKAGGYECVCKAGFDGDGNTCSRSPDITPSVQCRHDRMVVDMGLSNDHTVESYFLNNETGPGCSPPNTTEIIDIPLIGCGTTTLHNATHLVFQNKITVETVGRMESAVVNRDGLIEYEVDCAYARTGSSAGDGGEDGVYTMVSWSIGKTEFVLSNDTTLNFTLAGFADESYETPLSSMGDLFVLQRIYFQLGADLTAEMQSRFELVIVDIIAQDEEDPTSASERKYKIVDNGCVKDSTYRVEYPDKQSDSQKSFSLEAFSFIHDADAEVYLHGVVKLCDKESADFEQCKSVCQEETRRLRKRSIDLDEKFRVHTGPFSLGV